MKVSEFSIRTVCLFISALVAGCGGGAGGGDVTPATKLQEALHVEVDVPPVPHLSAGARKVKYVSTATRSAKIEVTPQDGLPWTSTSDCATKCEFDANVAPGDVTIKLSLFSGGDGSGNLLSTGNTSAVIVRGKQNTIALTLGGLVAGVAATFSLATVTVGTPSDIDLHLQMIDAAGRIIIGPAPFAEPVTLKIVGDEANQFTLLSSDVSSPSDAPIKIHYNGGSIAESVKILGTLGGQTLFASNVIAMTGKPVLSSDYAVSRNADEFVNSVGVVTHLYYTDRPYYTDFAKFRSLLLASGIKHIREGLYDVSGNDVRVSHVKSLAAAGIKATLVTTIHTPAQYAVNYPAMIPNYVEAFEGPNEYDASGDPSWISNLRNYQKDFYTTVKASTSTSSIPVIGPSLIRAEDYASVGDLSEFMDYGAIHNYYGNNYPGSAGWGGAGFGSFYGALKWWRGAAAQMSGTKPVITTETGSCTFLGQRGGITPAVQGKYVPRIVLEQWNAGVPRTMLYEFLDEGTGCDGALGITTADLTPKPAYKTLSGLLNKLERGYVGSSGSSPALTINGESTNVHHTLLDKGNGQYVLVLWLELPGWDLAKGTAILNAPQRVQLSLPKSPSISQLTSFNDNGESIVKNMNWENGKAELNATDQISILEFTL